MLISRSNYLQQDYADVYNLEDKMLRVGEDYAIYETVDKNHHYEDVYNYVVDRYDIAPYLKIGILNKATDSK